MLRFSPILAPNIMYNLKTIKKKDKKYLIFLKKGNNIAKFPQCTKIYVFLLFISIKQL